MRRELQLLGQLERETAKIPGRILRGRLAERYDGIGQYVLVSIAGSSTSSALKARIAAGDFGGRREFPRGTPVTLTVSHGYLEVFLGNRGKKSKRILLAVVASQLTLVGNETIPPSVNVQNALGIPWNLLAFNSYPFGDPSGAGSQSAINISLWWVDLPVSRISVLYAQTDSFIGGYVFEVDGIAQYFTPELIALTSSGQDLVNRPGDNSFGVGAGNGSVLFGAYAVQLLGYAYGNITTGLGAAQTLIDKDRVGNDYIAYPGNQDVGPPWVWIGYERNATSISTHIDTSYVYSPNGRAWVAASIPLVGPFVVIQQTFGDGNVSQGNDLSIDLPNDL